MPLITSDITKAYRKKNVLKGISLNISEGNIVGLLGENGSGKSTFLSILAGIQKPNGGLATLDGVDIIANSKFRASNIAYVPQGTPLIEELTAYDNLLMWYSKKEILRSIDEGVLGMLGIGDFLKVSVKNMSGGMKKRLAIGCAVSGNPKVILLDEPTAALDMVCKERIYTYFEAFKNKGGIILIATHELQEIQICDECYILKNGYLENYTFDGNILNLISRL